MTISITAIEDILRLEDIEGPIKPIAHPSRARFISA
jgi:hypothetical protein